MEPITIEIKGIQEIRDSIMDLKNEISTSAQNNSQYWYSLRAACALKGVNLSTTKGSPYLQPLGGREEDIIHGVKMWSRETILEWISVTDRKRVEYLEKHGIIPPYELQKKWEVCSHKVKSGRVIEKICS